MVAGRGWPQRSTGTTPYSYLASRWPSVMCSQVGNRNLSSIPTDRFSVGTSVLTSRLHSSPMYFRLQIDLLPRSIKVIIFKCWNNFFLCFHTQISIFPFGNQWNKGSLWLAWLNFHKSGNTIIKYMLFHTVDGLIGFKTFSKIV